MIALFTESFLFWLLCVGFAAGFTFALWVGTRRKSMLILGLSATLATTFLGAFCLCCVETDRKAVRRTVEALAAAVDADDVDATLALVSPTALKTRFKARAHMGLARIEWAKVRDLEIVEINRYTSPPRALVRFRGSVGGRVSGFDASRFTVVVDFSEVELREEEPGVWRVTDRCRFSYPGYSGEINF